MSSFSESYSRLNPEQKRAVDKIQGPVLVIAGPGTGKTELLSMRVANILAKTDTDSNSILCLTFTNKAADNMKRRLLKLVGQDAHGVAVRTFHSLAADIMNRYPQYFWRGAKLTIAADATQLQVINTVLAALPSDHPLALTYAGQFTMADAIGKAINLAKEAGLTPDKLRALLQSNLAYIDLIEPQLVEIGQLRISAKALPKIDETVGHLPKQPVDKLIAPLVSLDTVIQESYAAAVMEAEATSKATPLSKWKARWIQLVDGERGMHDERQRNLWWLGLADVYERYRRELHGRGFYDFADMLVEVIGQVEQHPDLRASLQEQFQYVLIDEFQDTNAAQLRLAHLIADHPELPSPNIMAVGDDDQSIFKFQGAELNNMLGFTRQYTDAEIVVLTKNYRSTQTVLDNAEKVILHAKYRLVHKLDGLSKNLVATSPAKSKGIVAHYSYRSREEQLSDAADSAKALLGAGSVAVLARHHTSLRDIAGLLHLRGVPIKYEQSSNVLDLPAVEQLHIILDIVHHIKLGERSSVNALLSTSLRHPMWAIPPMRLWEFAVHQQRTHDWLGGLVAHKDPQLHAIGAWLEWLVSISTEEPLAVVFEYALGLRPNDILDSPLRAHYIARPQVNETYLQTLSGLHVLRGLVAEFAAGRTARVDDFVRFIELMKKTNRVVNDTSPFVSDEHSVELFTVHKAKGLEFDAVLIIDAVEPEWSPRTHGRIPPANLPLRPAEDDDDDYTRLMYVAATRAKHTLSIYSHRFSTKGDDVRPAPSLSQLAPQNQPELSGKVLEQLLSETLAWPRLKQEEEQKLLRPLVETFRLNVSNLINFLDVSRGGPAYFKERNLLRLPEAKSAPAAFGSAMHAALEEAQLEVNAGKLRLESVYERFQLALLNEGLPEADYKQRLSRGLRQLKWLLEQKNLELVQGANPEYVIDNVVCNGAPLNGTLDVLLKRPDSLTITDYKTGTPLSSLDARAGAAGIKAWRHKLQLVFYALLAELDPTIRSKGNALCQMMYVEADKNSAITRIYQPTPDEVTRLASLIQAVWDHIARLDFPDISSYSPDVKGIKQFEQDLLEATI